MLKVKLQLAVLTLSVSATSCWFRKAPPVFTPPPVAAAPPAAAPDPSALPTPPTIEGDPNSTVPPPTPESMPKAEGKVPPAPVKPPSRRGNVSTAPVKPPAAQADSPPPPRLGQIFTPEQRREYTKALEESLDRVRKALGVLDRKPLNPEQADIRNRIRTFQKQAEQAREQDLVTAVNLARRADLLAKDLLERLP